MQHTRLPETWDNLNHILAIQERAHAAGFIFDIEEGAFCRPGEPGVWRNINDLDAQYDSWVSVHGEPCILQSSGRVCPDAEWYET